MQLIHSLVAWISITASNADVAITVTSQFQDGNTSDWFTYGHCLFALSRSYSPGEMEVTIVTNYPASSSRLTASNMTVNAASGNMFFLSNENTEHPGYFTLSFELRYPSSGSLAGYCSSNVEYVETTSPETADESSSTTTAKITTSTLTTKLSSTTMTTTAQIVTPQAPSTTVMTQTPSSTTVTSQVPSSTTVTTQATSTMVTSQAPSTTSSPAPAGSTSSAVVGDTTAIAKSNLNTQTIGPNSSSAAGCMCSCKEMGSAANTNYTEKELAKKINEIVEALVIDKKKTSVAQRKLQSARDDRPSARAVGTVAILLISVALGILILFDIDNFIRFITKLKRSKT